MHRGDMNKELPARPSLEHLKGQAKSLLSAVKNQDSDALSAVKEFHPDQAGEFQLSDAQLVVARKNGFDSWPKLSHYVELLRDLEGTWAFTSLEVDGNTMPVNMLGSSSLVMNGDRFNMLSPEADYIGVFDIDVEANPKTIDIDFIEGPEAGNSSYGIFELNGDDLTICLGLTGASRPVAFETKPGTQHALETLRRVERSADIIEPKASSPEPLNEQPTVDPAEFMQMTPELEPLQGDWIPLEVVNNGVPIPENYMAYGSRNCTGTHTKVIFGGQAMVDAHVKAYADGRMDYLIAGGKQKGQLQFGIYELDGDTLRVCMGEVGGDRPNDFTCTPGSGRTYSVWKKK